MPKTLMDRRTVLKGGIAIALAGHTAVASADVAEAPLEKLIREHKDAVALDRAGWTTLSEIEETEVMESRPFPKVQTARTWLGRGDDGEAIYQPSYSYTEDHIREVYERHDMWKPGRMFHGPQPWVAQAQAAHYVEMDKKVAELRAISAERQRIEDECGYTAAYNEAHRRMEIVRDLEQEIIAHVPSDLSEAVQKANWCVWAADDDHCYLSDTSKPEKVLIEALAAIGRISL